MDKLILNTDGKTRELSGIEDIGIESFNCNNCKENLVTCQITKKCDISTRIKARCCFCGGHSDIKIINGQFFIGAANDNLIFDIEDNHEHGCDVMLITKLKNKG